VLWAQVLLGDFFHNLRLLRVVDSGWVL
jgi:hypothetical protein